MIECVERFPAQLQVPLFSQRDRLRQIEVEVIRAVRMESIAADRGGIGEPGPFHPMHVTRTHTGAGVGILITTRTLQENDCTGVQRRTGTADIGPVPKDSIVVSIRAVPNREGSSRLKCGNTRYRPTSQS